MYAHVKSYRADRVKPENSPKFKGEGPRVQNHSPPTQGQKKRGNTGTLLMRLGFEPKMICLWFFRHILFRNNISSGE